MVEQHPSTFFHAVFFFNIIQISSFPLLSHEKVQNFVRQLNFKKHCGNQVVSLTSCGSSYNYHLTEMLVLGNNCCLLQCQVVTKIRHILTDYSEI